MFSPEQTFSNWKVTGFGNSPALLFETLESTHSLMKAKSAAGEVIPGTLIVANSQSAGRGRHERSWESPAGLNLYFNILIPLDGIPLSKAAQITQIAALTFAEIFKGLQEDAISQGSGNTALGKVTVKWPNDILCGKHKFCGILAEVIYAKGVDGTLKPAVSMGVGINVNSNGTDYARLERPITTLKDICGKTVNREKLLQLLIASLERAVGQFKAFGIRPWVESWRQMDLFIGTRGTIIENSVKKSGIILDMQDDGSLLFKCDDGTTETVYSADLEI